MIKRISFETVKEFFCTDTQATYRIVDTIGCRANAPFQTNANRVSSCASVKKNPKSARKFFCFRNDLIVRARLLLGVFVIGLAPSVFVLFLG